MLGIFLDTETTGLNPHKHFILEIALVIINVETGKRLASYETVIAQPRTRWEVADANSLTVNGFTWERVLGGKPEDVVAQEIIDLFQELGVQRGKAVFICQNPSFDRAYFSQMIDPDLQEELNWPYHWLDLASMYWAIQMDKEPLPWTTGVSKDRISETYQIAPEEKPHKAMNGVRHLLSCYEALVGYPVAAK